MSSDHYARFQNWSFDSFRKAALNTELSAYEKIGFPNDYRQGKEEAIWADILSKLTNLHKPGQLVLDIGPGCSDLPRFMITHCQQLQHQLVLADSAEMLALLPDGPRVTKLPGYYPRDSQQLFATHTGKVNVILVYSVLQYVFVEGNLFDFLDRSVDLLAEGGEMLIGDIPNVSLRKRFFASPAGIRYHQQFMQTTEEPVVRFNTLDQGALDDGIVFGILMRFRLAGYDAYVLPQSPQLPMANRREDVLIRKP